MVIWLLKFFVSIWPVWVSKYSPELVLILLCQSQTSLWNGNVFKGVYVYLMNYCLAPFFVLLLLFLNHVSCHSDSCSRIASSDNSIFDAISVWLRRLTLRLRLILVSQLQTCITKLLVRLWLIWLVFDIPCAIPLFIFCLTNQVELAFCVWCFRICIILWRKLCRLLYNFRRFIWRRPFCR